MTQCSGASPCRRVTRVPRSLMALSMPPVLTRALDAPLKRGNAALPTDHSTRTTAGHRAPNEGRSLYETPGHHLKHPCVGDCARGDGRNTGARRQQSLPTTVVRLRQIPTGVDATVLWMASWRR